MTRLRFATAAASRAFALLRRDKPRCTPDRGGFVVIGGGSSLLACPLCFGAEETSMIDGRSSASW